MLRAERMQFERYADWLARYANSTGCRVFSTDCRILDVKETDIEVKVIPQNSTGCRIFLYRL